MSALLNRLGRTGHIRMGVNGVSGSSRQQLKRRVKPNSLGRFMLVSYYYRGGILSNLRIQRKNQ